MAWCLRKQYVYVAWYLVKKRYLNILIFIIINAVLIYIYNRNESRDSSVGIALDYGLFDRDSSFRFPAEAGNFSLHHDVQNGYGPYPAA
jgi:hypothetical protein